MSNPTITINVNANTSQANNALKGVGNSLGNVGGTGSKKAAMGLGSVVGMAGKLVPALAGAGAAFLALRKAMSVVKEMVAVNMQFEDTMAAVRAVAQTSGSFTEGAFKRMSAEARALGATTRFSATEAAEGLKFLSMAGFTAEESTAALGSTLKLAQAGALDLGSAADIVSNIMTAFGGKANETAQYANALAVVAARSNTDITQLGEAMKYIGPIAGGLGRDVEEVSAAIGTLGNAGVQSSMAGTALRGVLIQLADPTSKAHRALREMGMTMEELDMTDPANSMVQVFQRMADVGVDATNSFSIFGARAGVAAQQLTANIGKFRELEGEVKNNRGALDEMAETMDDTLTGASKRVRSAWQEMLLQFGDSGINDILREIVEDVAAMISKWNESGAIVAAGQKVAMVIETIYNALKDIASSDTGTVIGWIADGMAKLIKYTSPMMRMVDTLERFNNLIGMSTAKSMESRADDFGNFFDEVQKKAKAATSEADAGAIGSMLDKEKERLMGERKMIEENGKLSKRQRADEIQQIDQQLKLVRQMQGLKVNAFTGQEVETDAANSLTARVDANVAAAQAAEKEAAAAEKITEESLSAKEAVQARAEAMEKMLADDKQSTGRKGIDDKFKEFGQARAKFSAVLKFEKFDSSFAVQDEIDELASRIDAGKNGEGVISDDDVTRLQHLLKLMEDLRQIKQRAREEKAQAAEDAAEAEAEKSKGTIEADRAQKLLDMKLAGDKAGVAAMERENAIAEKTEQLKKQNIDNAEARATAMVNAEAKLAKQKEEADKVSMTTKGSFASAIDRIMGRSANELIAKEAQRQTALAENQRTEQSGQTTILQNIQIGVERLGGTFS